MGIHIPGMYQVQCFFRRVGVNLFQGAQTLVCVRHQLTRCFPPLCCFHYAASTNRTEGDTNQDGIVTVAESGDLATITCGCPDENGVLETAPPTPTSVTSSVGNPTPRTEPPVDAPTTPANTEPTLPPLPISQVKKS